MRSPQTAPLSSIAEIAVGLQTSADKIYIFQPIEETETTYRFKYKNNIYEVEKDICKPCLYDLSLELFDTVVPNAKIIFPYIIQGGKAEVFSEQYFQANFPLTWNYLNGHKETLVKRSINGSKEPKWYQYGRSQSLTRFHDTPKLIWSVLSTKPGYIFDENNLQFTGGGNGPYYSLFAKSGYSLHYILGILSHPVIEAMVKSGASEFRGAYYSHGKQFIENLPIRLIDFKNKSEVTLYKEIIKAVNGLIETKQASKSVHVISERRVLQRKMNVLWNLLISKVNLLYGLSDEDIREIETDELLNCDINED